MQKARRSSLSGVLRPASMQLCRPNCLVELHRLQTVACGLCGTRWPGWTWPSRGRRCSGRCSKPETSGVLLVCVDWCNDRSSACLSIYLSVLFIVLWFCLSVSLSLSHYLSVCLSVYLSIHLSLYLSIYLSIDLSMYLSLSSSPLCLFSFSFSQPLYNSRIYLSI